MKLAINDRAAEVMAKIHSNIQATEDARQTRLAAEAERRREAAAAEAARLKKAREFFLPVIHDAARGCAAVSSLLKKSPALQSLVQYTEERRFTTAHSSRFHLFTIDALGKRDDARDDMHLFVSLRSNNTIEVFVSHFDEEKPLVIACGTPGNVADALKIDIICYGNFHSWNDCWHLERMVDDYKKIPSPLSWKIPVDFYQEAPYRFRLVALRVLAQCAQPSLLARHMEWALEYNAPPAG